MQRERRLFSFSPTPYGLRLSVTTANAGRRCAAIPLFTPASARRCRAARSFRWSVISSCARALTHRLEFRAQIAQNVATMPACAGETLEPQKRFDGQGPQPHQLVLGVPGQGLPPSLRRDRGGEQSPSPMEANRPYLVSGEDATVNRHAISIANVGETTCQRSPNWAICQGV